MNKRPKIALVKVQGNEIKLSKQIHFEVDSAKILGDSSLADGGDRRRAPARAEHQEGRDPGAHRQHGGSRAQPEALRRARELRAGLAGQGRHRRKSPDGQGLRTGSAARAERDRGQPAKNRRVQFIILEK
jgi:hypothetical protein